MKKLKGTDIWKNTIHWCIFQASTFNKILAIVILVANIIPPWEIYMQVNKQQPKLGMEQQACSKSGKKYVKAV